MASTLEFDNGFGQAPKSSPQRLAREVEQSEVWHEIGEK
jgi:hypothetical protein